MPLKIIRFYCEIFNPSFHEVVGFVSVVSKVCLSFRMTATTQKSDVTLRFEISLLFDTAFRLILKFVDFETLMDMAPVNQKRKLFVLIT